MQLPDFFFQLFIHELHSSQQDRHGIIEMVVFMCQKLRNMRHKSKSFKVITLSQNYAKDINYKQHSTCNYYILNLSVVLNDHINLHFYLTDNFNIDQIDAINIRCHQSL